MERSGAQSAFLAAHCLGYIASPNISSSPLGEGLTELSLVFVGANRLKCVAKDVFSLTAMG